MLLDTGQPRGRAGGRDYQLVRAIQARDCPLASRADPAELEFGVKGLGFRVKVLGFRVKGLGFGISGLGFRVEKFRISGSFSSL